MTGTGTGPTEVAIPCWNLVRLGSLKGPVRDGFYIEKHTSGDDVVGMSLIASVPNGAGRVLAYVKTFRPFLPSFLETCFFGDSLRLGVKPLCRIECLCFACTGLNVGEGEGRRE